MTFDEAIENINVLSAFSTVYGISPTVVRDIISKLKEEYSPTVEMTEDEKNVLVEFKKNWTFTQFIRAIEGNYENNMYFEKVEKTFRKMRIANGYMIDEDKLMLAWLHPETIKVVDE